jgi:cytochrome c peroxidase
VETSWLRLALASALHSRCYFVADVGNWLHVSHLFASGGCGCANCHLRAQAGHRNLQKIIGKNNTSVQRKGVQLMSM